ncbi:MAG: hypothetical protein PHH47_10145 [Gallionella sp.]|nr:hypothetical protein [Gallionella sp.]MDD4946461.1 hypothetical protein [Gallionella sp.]
MQIQINLWELILALATLIGVFSSMIWLFGTILVKQFKALLDTRFSAIHDDATKRAEADAKVDAQLRQFEKDFLTFQRDIPLQYVRREDYIRGQTVIESKLDAVYSKLELVQIQGAKQHG